MKARFLLSLFCLLSASFSAGCNKRATQVAVPAQAVSPTSVALPTAQARSAIAPSQTCAPAASAVAPAAEANQAGSSTIEMGSWTKPSAGWLYVLDPKPESLQLGGCVWLLDPESGRIMGSIHTGDDADFTLSPDGRRLYIASDAGSDSSDLAVIDTDLGVIVQRATIADREVPNALPPFSTMAVSGDGLTLRILTKTPSSGKADTFLLAAFDTHAGEFLPGSVYLGNCGPGRFISYPTADQFDVFCPRTNRIRLISVDNSSHTLRNSDVVLPWERRIGVAEALELPGAQNISIVRGDGAVVKMDVATQGFADTAATFDLPARIFPAAWPTSPDGSKVYLGYNTGYDRINDNRFYLTYGGPPNVRADTATASEFRVYDTRTWQSVGKIKTTMRFWNAVVGINGKLLYATAPKMHSILVIDTVAMRETRAISIAGMPSLLLVAP